MARRRRRNSRRRNNRFIAIVLLLLVLAVSFVFAINIFRPKDNIKKINEILSLNSVNSICSISKISSVNTQVYSNKGIKYTNKHDNIIKLNSYDSSKEEDLKEILMTRTLLENLVELKTDETVMELPPKDDGYYWIKINFRVKEKVLIFKNEKQYNIDLYYDVVEEKIYIKNKYYEEFSTKNNKAKLTGYIVDENYKKLIEDLAMAKQ